MEREISEHYNALIRNLRLRTFLDQERVALGICAATGCGKSSVVASNLAICLANSTERNVLFVNANPDNRVPQVVFPKIGDGYGFYDMLLNDAELRNVIRDTDIPNLFTIGHGESTNEISTASCMIRFRALLEQLRDEFSLVLIGLPIASDLTPCYDMAAELDGVIVEFEADRVKRRAAKSTINQLNAAGANLLGCVFKQV